MAKEFLDKLTPFVEHATTGRFADAQLECKHYFSGAALYADRRICLTLTPVGLALKLPEKTKQQLLDNNTAMPLRYFSKAPIKKAYVLFPGGIKDDTKQLHSYVQECIAYVLTLPKSKRKRK